MDMADNDGAKAVNILCHVVCVGVISCFAFSGRELSDGGSCFDKGGDGYRT